MERSGELTKHYHVLAIRESKKKGGVGQSWSTTVETYGKKIPGAVESKSWREHWGRCANLGGEKKLQPCVIGTAFECTCVPTGLFARRLRDNPTRAKRL